MHVLHLQTVDDSVQAGLRVAGLRNLWEIEDVGLGSKNHEKTTNVGAIY